MAETEKRNAYWDNAKTVLIFLVVLGHYLITMGYKEDFAEAVYQWIYLFHMPAFVFVSGYFSKSFVKKRGDNSKLLGFLVLYVVFTLMLWGTDALTIKELTSWSLFTTGGAQWYMLAMFFWYLSLLFVAGFSGKVTVPIAFIMGLLIGFDKNAGNFLSMSRVFVFYPFFLLGYYFTEDWIEKITLKFRVIGATVLSGIFVVLLLYRRTWMPVLRCVYGNKSYEALEFSNIEGFLYRALWYIVALVMTAAFLCVIGQKRRFYTFVGEYTLPVYIAHRVLRDVFVALGLYSAIGYGIAGLIVCVVISFFMLFFCANKTFGKLCNMAFRIGDKNRK